MKKVLFLIVSIVILGLVFAGCGDIVNITTPSDVDSLEKNSLPTITWTGQGMASENCDIPYDDNRPEEGWIHWVLTGTKGVTSAELVLGGGSTYEPTKYGSVLQFFTPYFDLDTLTAFVNYSGSLKKNSQFVISDYCPGDSGEEPTTYTVTFSVYAGSGSISATDDSVGIASSDPVVAGSEVVFTATPDSGYQIKDWYVDGSPITSTNATYTIVDLQAAVNVQVEFEEDGGTNWSDEIGIYDYGTGGYMNIGDTVVGNPAPPALDTYDIRIENITGVVIYFKGCDQHSCWDYIEELGPGEYFNEFTSAVYPNRLTSVEPLDEHTWVITWYQEGF